ncbi:helix-turn-helix domain-containing protein [Streptomyces sp. NPDC005708]|uniref:helix-turn-helix domain-containing protein n=1 Tax=Streptomyces sp. NPDC005708 TaxID=3154564 RepID=UPI003410BAA7
MSWTTDPDAWAQLGRRIKTARDRQGFTQVELADRAGVSLSAISNAEAGRVPRGRRWPYTLTAIERALGWGTGSMTSVLDGGEPLAPSETELAVEAPAPEPSAPFVPQFRRMGWLAAHGREVLEEALQPARQLGHLCALLGASDERVDAYDQVLKELLEEVRTVQGWPKELPM